jgi:hypothetical protein
MRSLLILRDLQPWRRAAMQLHGTRTWGYGDFRMTKKRTLQGKGSFSLAFLCVRIGIPLSNAIEAVVGLIDK